ncbi:hypothetical protein [Methanobrevibacter sp.]|uniref:hypothetical protein n=1 Tax=Methanobrevibacter sp. TaxID=66852 RepID=UPI00388F12D8
MNLGFSFVGLIFLVMLFTPNIIWTRNKPYDYEKYAGNENRILSVLEQIGQVLVVLFSLIIFDSTIIWPIEVVAFALMVLYEIYWIRYFQSSRSMKDMYSSFLKIPVAGATLPVLAFFLLGISQNNILLVISTVILGIGHIGIHLAHEKEVS